MQITLDPSASTEAVILKLHLLAESHLYRLLGLRLEIEEQHLPALQFFALAKLALGGNAYKTTLVKILALNDLRNQYSHELDAEQLNPAFETFCAKTDMFWPPADVANNPPAFAELRKGAVVSGAIVAVTELWCHFAELFASKYEAVYSKPSELRAIAAESARAIDAIRQEQNAVRQKFS